MPDINPLKGLSKTQTYIAVGGAFAVFGYIIIHHHSTSGSWNPFNSGSATATTATDPLTGLPVSQDNTIDPITGLSYLSEAQQYGSVATAEASVSAYGQSSASGSGIPVNPAVGQSNQGSANTVVGGSVYTSDSAWSQAAQAGLTDIGYTGTDVADALGLYLTGQAVDATQAQLINAAIAEFGAPPQGTFQIILKPASTPSTAAAPKVTVPQIAGATVNTGQSRLRALGLKTSAGPGTSGYIITSTNPPAGATVAPGTTVAIFAKK